MVLFDALIDLCQERGALGLGHVVERFLDDDHLHDSAVRQVGRFVDDEATITRAMR